MSAEYPIIAITGSSGSGSSSVTRAFHYMFRRERVKAAYIQGSAFHRYDRQEMYEELKKAATEGRNLSHYGPEGNHLEKLESLLIQYGTVGTGMYRYYLHTQKHADIWGQQPGTFTQWKNLKKNSDLLFYRGLHGAAVDGDIDISLYPDLLIGIVPGINLEWTRKIYRDMSLRDYSMEEVKQSILSRMHDYAHYITPQFSRTHVNFQLVPVIETSNPFTMDSIPAEDDCILVIHFQRDMEPDYAGLMRQMPDSFMSSHDTLVVPGGQFFTALELIMMPVVHKLVETSREIRQKKPPPKKKCGLLGALGQSLQ